jgi:hypothetical protein
MVKYARQSGIDMSHVIAVASKCAATQMLRATDSRRRARTHNTNINSSTIINDNILTDTNVS